MSIGKRISANKEAPEPQGRIRVKRGTYQKAMLRRTIMQILLALFALVLVYVVFAVTLVRVIPANEGFVLIKNNTFSGGRVPVGEVVMISTTTDQDDSYTNRLEQSFIPQSGTAIVEVVAGPAGSIKWDPSGEISVDGNKLPVLFPVDPKKEYLNSEYIAICLKGACNVGEPLFFSDKRIYGVPLSGDDFKSGADLNTLKEKVKGSSARPQADEIAIWVRGTKPKLNEAQATCMGELFYKSDLPDEALTYFVEKMIAGEIPEAKDEDQAIIDQVNKSSEAAQCRKEFK